MRGWIDRLGWKLFSAAAAGFLWYGLAGEIEVATSVPVTVQYRNIPPDLEITTESPNEMFLKLRGPSERLAAREMSNVVVIVDLSNVHAPGDQTITVGEEQLNLPRGVRLVRSAPSQIRVNLEKRAEKTVPVEVRYAGPPPEGYRIVAQRVYPSSVRVTGPESRVNRLEATLTDPIDLSSTVGKSEFRVPLVLEDPHLRLESGSPSMVTAHVTLEKIPGK